MKIVATFWKWLAIWTGLVGALYVDASLLGGGGAGVRALPVSLGMALVLASYPAGIAVSGSVFGNGGPSRSQLTAFVEAAVSACVVLFLLTNWLAPAVAEAGVGPAGGHLPWPQLRAAVQDLAVTTSAGPATVDAWLPFNEMAFNYVRRTDGTVLPALFACVGLLVGYWAPRLGRPGLTRLAHWGVGLFLMVSTYFAGENGFEMIVLQSAGPVAFAADLVLIVPGTLIIGLGLATLADLRATKAS